MELSFPLAEPSLSLTEAEAIEQDEKGRAAVSARAAQEHVTSTPNVQ
jgi:hypothetical protein